jgi:hypothetical protein
MNTFVSLLFSLEFESSDHPKHIYVLPLPLFKTNYYNKNAESIYSYIKGLLLGAKYVDVL